MNYPKPFQYTRFSPSGLMEMSEVTFSSRLILEKATELGIAWREIPGTKLFELSYKGKKTYFRGQIPFDSHFIGCYSCQDKSVCKGLLIDAGINLPKGFSIYKNDPQSYWKEVFDSLQKPLVVKPSHGNQGRSVHMNITEYEQYVTAIEDCLRFSQEETASAIVEETFRGQEYRILASNKEVIGIIYRKPANVTGDGTSTIKQLIDQKNADIRRSDNPNDVLVKIKVDSHVLQNLEKQNLTVDSVPENGKVVYLRLNSNISTGGDSIDITDKVHPSVIDIAMKTMKAFPGLALAGIDFMSTDITQPQSPETYCIIELNDSPGFSIHDFPFEGKNRNATSKFLELLFPELELTR